MTRKFLLTIDGDLAAVASDAKTFCEKASYILAERCEAAAFVGKHVPDGLIPALRGQRDEFDFMEEAGAPVTDMLIMEHAASRTRSFRIGLHELEPKTVRSMVLSSVDIARHRSPACMMFQAVNKIFEDHAEEGRILNDLGKSLDRLVTSVDEDNKTKTMARIVSDLREFQDAFGPEEGHPFRVVPEWRKGEQPREVLDQIAAVAKERVRTVVENLPWKAPVP